MKTLSTWFVLAAGIIVSGCAGDIPEAYRGDYVDATRGATLKLEKNSGSLTTPDGRQIAGETDPVGYEGLAKGEAGFFYTENKDKKRLIDVYWIKPDKNSRQTDANLVWMNSEVIYTVFDPKIEKEVQGLEMLYCRDGRIMLDPVAKLWQVGCPAGPVYFDFTRKR